MPSSEHMVGAMLGALQVVPDSIEQRGTGSIVTFAYAGTAYRVQIDTLPVSHNRRKGEHDAQTIPAATEADNAEPPTGEIPVLRRPGESRESGAETDAETIERLGVDRALASRRAPRLAISKALDRFTSRN